MERAADLVNGALAARKACSRGTRVGCILAQGPECSTSTLCAATVRASSMRAGRRYGERTCPGRAGSPPLGPRGRDRARLQEDPRAEADAINYAPRLKAPTLMLNGKYDSYFLPETSQKFLFELLGTPEKKRRARGVEETPFQAHGG